MGFFQPCPGKRDHETPRAQRGAAQRKRQIRASRGLAEMKGDCESRPGPRGQRAPPILTRPRSRGSPTPAPPPPPAAPRGRSLPPRRPPPRSPGAGTGGCGGVRHFASGFAFKERWERGGGWGGAGSRGSALWQSARGGHQNAGDPRRPRSVPASSAPPAPPSVRLGFLPADTRAAPHGPEPPRVSEGGAAATPPPPPSRLRKRSVRRGQRGICIAQMAARRFKAAAERPRRPTATRSCRRRRGRLRGDAAVAARKRHGTTRHDTTYHDTARPEMPAGRLQTRRCLPTYDGTAGPGDGPDIGTPLTAWTALRIGAPPQPRNTPGVRTPPT